MKYALFSFFAALLLINSQKAKGQSPSTTKYQIAADMEQLRSTPADVKMLFRCQRNTENASNENTSCPMYFDRNTAALQCASDENCSMYVVNGTYTKPLSGSVRTSLAHVIADYQRSTHNAPVDAVTIHVSYSSKSEFIQLHYKEANGQQQSVAYSLKYEQNAEGDYILSTE